LSTSTTTGTLKVTGGAGITEKLFVGSDLSVGGNLSVTGNITFGGSSTVLTATNLEVTDSLIYLASTQYTTDSMDIGIFGAYSPTGTGHVHTGLVRNSSSKVWNLISGAAEPTGNSVSLTGVTYDILKIGSLQVTDAATTRTNLGLAIGTNVQAYNSALTSISSTQVTNWDTAYTDRNKWDGASIAGSGTVEIARSTLGLGTMAVETATGYYAKAPTILGASEDLNLKTTAGLYHQNANVDAASGTNYPAAQAGMLIVHVGEGFIYQQYQTYGISGANKIYHRGYYSAGNPVWSAWREVVNTDGATFTGAVALNGGFSVDSTAFSVADTTGNTSVGGTLSVSGTSTLSGHVTVASTKQSAIATSQTSTTAGTNTWSANKVVMTAGVASAAIPTFRPDGSALQAGDIWISW
jgi:hypothetical protein